MSDTPDLAHFRQDIDRFVRERLPAGLRQTVRQGQQPTREQLTGWHEVLAAEGCWCPTGRNHGADAAGACASRWSSTRRWRWATLPS
jgi:hypothetical protein